MIRIATAGWTIPRGAQDACAGDGSHLVRYARRLNGVEINSSFYRPHRPATYARWAADVPAAFRFAVKLPKAITHEARLVGTEAVLDRFLAEVAHLREKCGVLLVQLPPSFAFDATVVDAFLATLRARHAGAVACEPRHASWFERDADRVLVGHRVTRVAADPASVPSAAVPGGWLDDLVYFRWHGSPRMYWSAYDDAWLAARRLEIEAWSKAGRDVWCVFDNTGAGAALPDALRFEAMHPRSSRRAGRTGHAASSA